MMFHLSCINDIKKRKIINYIFIPICNYFFLCFFTMGFNANDFRVGMWIFKQFFSSAFWMPNTLVFIASFFLVYYYNYSKKLVSNTMKKYFFVLATIWSACFAFGKSYYILNNWMLVFGSPFNFIFILVLCSFSAVSITFFLILFLSAFKKLESVDISNFIFFKFKSVFFTSFISFFFIECLYVIAFFPGIITWDGRYQLTEFYGIYPLTNHHPIISTLFEGSIIEIGRLFGNFNLGLFLFIFLQSLIQSFLLAYTVKLISEFVQNKTIVLVSYLYFLFNPILAIWGISLGKDSIYYLSFLWFMILLVKILKYSDESIHSSIYVQLVFCILLGGFFRKEAAIIMAISLITAFLFSCYLKNSKKILIYIIGFYLIFIAAFSLFLNFYHVYSPKKEAFAIPFQQTARLVWSNKVLEKDDMENLDLLFGNQNLRKLYNPSFADPVKNAFVESECNYNTWREIYFKYLKIYPASYIQAIINQNYGYFYPFFKPIDYGYYTIPKDDVLRNDILPFSTISKAKSLQNFLKAIPEAFMGMPFLSLYYNCSFFVWSLMFLCGIALIRKCWSVIYISMPLLLTFSVCLLSPVGADTRYMLPIIVSYPLWGVVVFKELNIIK